MNHPRTEVVLPCAADDLRDWAGRVSSENPIGEGPGDYVNLEIDGSLHAGVELTFFIGNRRLHSLVLFGEPNANEAEIERTGA